MTDAKDDRQLFKSCRILLVEPDKNSSAYLRQTFEFLDCEVFCSESAGELVERASQASDRTISVFLSEEIARGVREEILQGLGGLLPKPALFQIQHDQSRDVLMSGEMLDSLTIPGHYDSLVALLHKAQVYRESQAPKGKQRPVELFRSLSGNSQATQAINKMIEQVADSEATVLILGESGTGKEVVARKLHYNSKRRSKPFVPINCGAIPADLLESELFGHEKGAFTGAFSARQGRFELADGGTLFLDEIGDMSIHMQVKLLRVLQERTFERVGSNKTIRCNVRIIAATHRHLEQAIEEGKFREDLYFRLNVFPIEVPPLRERTDDIPMLVSDLISRMEREKRGSVRLTPGAVIALQHCRWPGNVRELANLIERLAILFPYGVVDIPDLPEKIKANLPDIDVPTLSDKGSSPAGSPPPIPAPQEVQQLPQDGLDLKAHIVQMEINLIRQALDEADGVVAHAAKLLKMRRTTLVEKLRKYGLQRPQEMTGT